MAKSKDFKANPNAKSLPAVSAFIQNKDLLLRLSFMHQAASYLHQSQAAADLSFPGLTISTSAKRERLQPTKQGKTGKKKTGGRNRGKARTEDGRHGSLDRLARGIGRGIKEISVHNKAKLDPSFKRSICQVCSTVLIPGVSSELKVKPSSSHVNLIRQTCLYCSKSRSIPAPPTLPLPSLPSSDCLNAPPDIETTDNQCTPPEPFLPSIAVHAPPSKPSESTTPTQHSSTSSLPLETNSKKPRMSKKHWRARKQSRSALLSQREGSGHARWTGGPNNGVTGKLEEF